MARLPKIAIHNTILKVTTSLEEGLLLTADLLTLVIIESFMARAQKLHPVEIIAYVVEGNHIHFFFRLENPEDLRGFMKCFKTETAHAINSLLGKAKRTVWCEGYDSPVVLTLEDAVKEIAYIYTNPAKDNLEDSIDQFPGCNSWNAFLAGVEVKKNCPWIHRYQVEEVDPRLSSYSEKSLIAQKLIEGCTESNELVITPMGWLKAFGIESEEEIKAWHKRILDRVRQMEAEFRAAREKEGKTVMGRHKLMNSAKNLTYQSQRSGRKMWCICSNIDLRITFISILKALVEQGLAVYNSWKAGDLSRRYPIGLYAPSLPMRAHYRDAQALIAY